MSDLCDPATDHVTVEGLAAQLYMVGLPSGGACVWWHVLREDIKANYRNKARQQIVEFNERNRAPWDKPAASK